MKTVLIKSNLLFLKHFLKLLEYILPSKKQLLFLWVYGLTKENKIFTHLNFPEKKLLHKTVLSLNKPICVEIGSYYGSSSCFIADASKRKQGRLYCIDTWQNQGMTEGGKDTYSDFLENTSRFKDVIITIRQDSKRAIKEINKRIGHINFLFIDGDHSYNGCLSDWINYSPLLKTGALVAFHDTAWATGIKKVIVKAVLQKAELIDGLPNLQIYKVL